MAVSITNVLVRPDTLVIDVTATADADTTTGLVPHGMGAAPAIALVTPLLSAARVSDWIVETLDATNIELTKTTGAGSGAAGAQVRVTVLRPHSII